MRIIGVMNRTFLWLTIAVLAVAPAWTQPAPLSGFSDEGSFVFFVNEERVVTHTFQSKRRRSSWCARLNWQQATLMLKFDPTMPI